MVKNIFKLPNDDKGLGPDVARSMEDWDSFKEYHRKRNPIRYFLHHEFESMFVWPITHRVRKVYDWIKYRTTRRYHIVDTGLEPGYYDVSTRMFHANFNLLKDFVEIEKAHMYHVFTEHPVAKGKDGGIAYLLWEMGLSKEEGGHKQAENAREIFELYDWWTNERPYRTDPWTLVNEDARGFGRITDNRDKYEEVYGEMNKLEEKHAKEDEEMLIRLIKIREALWT